MTYLEMPLRRVTGREVTHPEHSDFYQTETLECGHTLRSSPNWKKARNSWKRGEWVWPERRRCWACWKAAAPHGPEEARGEE
jgi:hypothetical protein